MAAAASPRAAGVPAADAPPPALLTAAPGAGAGTSEDRFRAVMAGPEGRMPPDPTLTAAQLGGLSEKNTFLDCASPWGLQFELRERANSDPSSNTSSSCSGSSVPSSIGDGEDWKQRLQDFEEERRKRRAQKPQGQGGAGSKVQKPGPLVQKAESIALPSERPGDAGHETGTCRPCKWVTRNPGCSRGDNCSHCHLPHQPGCPGTRWRPNKQTRQAIKRALATAVTEASQNPNNGSQHMKLDANELPAFIQKNEFILSRLEKKYVDALSRNTGAKGAPPPPVVAESSWRQQGQADVITDLAAEPEYGKVYRL